jgi:hypothetical protein
MVAASAATAAIGAVGGLGGAVLLVPFLVVAGVPPAQAAPLGLVSVAAGSVAAGARQLADRSVNHRVGVSVELAATVGAVVGALVSGVVSERVLVVVLAMVALAAAVMSGRRAGEHAGPDPDFGPDDVGERVGGLSGVYPLGSVMVPYRVERLPLGLAFMGLAGLVAGTAGASGGFIKTPAMTEIMHVPTKVAASTTTFTIGITSAAALAVFAVQGRLDAVVSASVVFGALGGGWIGAHLQSRLSPDWIRRGLALILVVVAAVLLVSA